MNPMLAATIDDLEQIKNMYPLYASPKLDGIRALVINGTVYSRNLKPIPNNFIQKRLPLHHMDKWDGELVVGKPDAKDCFRQTTSGVMSLEGRPGFTFYVFDYIPTDSVPFKDRLSKLKTSVKAIADPRIKLVPQKLLTDPFKVYEYEETMLQKGFEGIMLRTLHGEYKHGRSTLKEGHLMKLKKFADSEAEVLELIEQMENTNEKTIDELGRSKRSSHKAGKVGKATLGSITVRDIHTDIVFDVGSGFDDATRQYYYDNPRMLIGKIIKYKYFPTGSKDKPRFPVFLGIRKD